MTENTEEGQIATSYETARFSTGAPAPPSELLLTNLRIKHRPMFADAYN